MNILIHYKEKIQYSHTLNKFYSFNEYTISITGAQWLLIAFKIHKTKLDSDS